MSRAIRIIMAAIALPTIPIRAEPHEFTQVHMGLPVRLVLYDADSAHAGEAARLAFERIATLDRMMSDYRPDSELRRLEARAGEPVVASRELFAVIDRAVEISRATAGAFDPTVAPLVALWREARRSGRLPAPADLERARVLVGCDRLELDASRSTVHLRQRGMRLDLGGIAKGYILQEALATLRRNGIRRALVEAGGDIVVGDAPPGRDGWTIDVSAGDADFRQAASRLTNSALSTSGADVQFVEIDGARYSHVVDPRTGLGVTNGVTAHVIAQDGATADALATALTVTGHQGVGMLRQQFPGVAIALTK
jgi:thiamine biosynthesis lipoprotein